MLSYALTALALVSSSAFAVPTPTTSEATVAALGSCEITWTADTDTKAPWTAMTIEMMTGSNQQMTHMRTVASNIDATKTTSFTWVCPDVDIYAPIYFYQFSSATDPSNLQWVTRFTITSTSGSSVPAPETDTSGVGWGLGHFVDSSLYNAMPTYLNGNGQLQGAPGNGTSTTGGNGTSTGSVPGSSTTPVGGSSTGSSTGTGTSSVATITKGSSSSTASSTQTATSSTQSGAASVLSSSSVAAVAGALFAGVAALF